MGFIRPFVDAVAGSWTDQWKDFLTVPLDLSPTAALFPAVPQATNAGRGTNVSASESVISNGSKIVVPEGFGLLTLEDGELTGLVTEPGGYIWDSNAVDAQSIFFGDGFVGPLIRQSWERYKFGGRPGSQQQAIFVSLKELPNNKFGTQSPIYWDDAYLRAQVAAKTRGTYTLRIVDPILFAMSYLPAPFLLNGEVFDFTDTRNAAAHQLFTEVVSSLASAFSLYTNDPARGNRIAAIQQDSVGFAASLSQAVEDNYRWRTDRGLVISKVSILGIDYDEATRGLLQTVQRADALTGSRGNSNLQASVAAGIEAAGDTGGSPGLLGMAVAANSMGLSTLAQPTAAETSDSPTGLVGDGAETDELLVRLRQLKRAFDSGLITQADYDQARAQALGL